MPGRNFQFRPFPRGTILSRVYLHNRTAQHIRDAEKPRTVLQRSRVYEYPRYTNNVNTSRWCNGPARVPRKPRRTRHPCPSAPPTTVLPSVPRHLDLYHSGPARPYRPSVQQLVRLVRLRYFRHGAGVLADFAVSRHPGRVGLSIPR